MRPSIPVAFLLVGLASFGAGAQQWPQWRGPNRDGIAAPTAVPASWPEKPLLKWKQKVGEGYSTPVVANSRLFVHSRRDPEEVVSAFELASGKLVWSKTYPAPF